MRTAFIKLVIKLLQFFSISLAVVAFHYCIFGAEAFEDEMGRALTAAGALVGAALMHCATTSEIDAWVDKNYKGASHEIK